jgi:predicted phage terminase large subunit-like protein
VEDHAKEWGARRILVEDSGAGISLVQELQSRISGIIAVKPEGDKVSRMAVASAKFEAGQVLLPERAAWLPDLEAELFVFPGSRHDDQCDSISQAAFGPKQFMLDVAVTRRLGEPPRPSKKAGTENVFRKP